MTTAGCAGLFRYPLRPWSEAQRRDEKASEIKSVLRGHFPDNHAFLLCTSEKSWRCLAVFSSWMAPVEYGETFVHKCWSWQ